MSHYPMHHATAAHAVPIKGPSSENSPRRNFEVTMLVECDIDWWAQTLTAGVGELGTHIGAQLPSPEDTKAITYFSILSP